MSNYNIIIVYSRDRSRVLMCRRKKPPYAGMLNFLGGHIEQNEDSEHAAYRELKEESGITDADIKLFHVMDLSYLRDGGAFCEVWFGNLMRDLAVHDEVNKLVWISADEDFSDITRFAGCGNIYHMIQYIEAHLGSFR